MSTKRHSLSSDEVLALLDSRTPGFSLPAPMYVDEDVYNLDIDTIFTNHWLFSATEAQIPDAGDYITIDIGPYSIMILRDDDEEIRAFHNVCRHRGAKLLEGGCGSLGNIVCPYHQWTYRSDGELMFAEAMPSTIDKSQFGLRPVSVRVMEGLVFICLSNEPPRDFDEFQKVAEPFLKPYQLAKTKVAYQTDLVEEGNWKLVMENNRECQHCDGAHPQLVTAYFPLFGYEEEDITPRMRPVFNRYQAASDDLKQSCKVVSFPETSFRDLIGRPTGFRISHLPLDGDGASFGANGASVCKKRMGSIPRERFGDLSMHLQPNAWFHFLSDHAVVFQTLPVSPNRSIVRTVWLVPEDAEEGIDYEIETLTGVWQATNNEDRELVGRAQLGVTSPGYVPGPYSMVEDDVDAFATWYVDRLRKLATNQTSSNKLSEAAQ